LLVSLIGCSPATPSAGASGASRDVAGANAAGGAPARTGADLFNGNCTACHQPNGRGIPGIYPSLAASPTALGDPKALALWVIEGQRAATMPAGRYSTSMPQFGWLKPGDAAALFTYIRSSFGNHAPPVNAATVAGALEESRR
jgi:mono/diheme cytochrome c family protein